MSGLREQQLGALLVFGLTAAWSFGGDIARFLSVTNSWVIVFWRSFFRQRSCLHSCSGATPGSCFAREQVAGTTWLAIAAVIVGVGIMVSGAISGHAHVQMPGVFLGTFTGAVIASSLASSFQVNGTDAFLLFLFGALNLGLGMAFFATGAPLLPSTLAAWIGVAEPVLESISTQE